jgi:hypothetical protein
MAKRSTKFYRKNEEEVMKRFGFIPTKNSGAGWIEKEDGYNEFLLAQLKSTDADSVAIKIHDLHKLEYNSIVAHKIPVFMVEFIQHGEVYVMVKPNDLPSLSQYLNCGESNVISSQPIIELDNKEAVTKVIKTIKSSSKGRAKFFKERENEFKGRK